MGQRYARPPVTADLRQPTAELTDRRGAAIAFLPYQKKGIWCEFDPIFLD